MRDGKEKKKKNKGKRKTLARSSLMIFSIYFHSIY